MLTSPVFSRRFIMMGHGGIIVGLSGSRFFGYWDNGGQKQPQHGCCNVGNFTRTTFDVLIKRRLFFSSPDWIYQILSKHSDALQLATSRWSTSSVALCTNRKPCAVTNRLSKNLMGPLWMWQTEGSSKQFTLHFFEGPYPFQMFPGGSLWTTSTDLLSIPPGL